MASKDQANKIEEVDSIASRFETKARLDVNDLIRRRSEEKKVDKKTNLLIFSGAIGVAAVVLLILNL